MKALLLARDSNGMAAALRLETSSQWEPLDMRDDVSRFKPDRFYEIILDEGETMFRHSFPGELYVADYYRWRAAWWGKLIRFGLRMT